MDNLEMLAEQIVTMIQDMNTPIAEYTMLIDEIKKVMVRRLQLVIDRDAVEVMIAALEDRI